MREARSIMGMPVILEIVDAAPADRYEKIFTFFRRVDERFSTYKDTSEISAINRGEILEGNYSREMREMFALAEETKKDTNGYFNIHTPDGSIDPSGIVKGWAINTAADLLHADGYENFYLEIAGDIQTSGRTSEGEEWSIGIRNPMVNEEIVKVIYPQGKGIATSGTYIRGNHIYNPHAPGQQPEVGEQKAGDESPAYVSLTVIGPNVYEADRFATAAFAMGEKGLYFLENLPGFEAYAIKAEGIAQMTSGFELYTIL